MGSVLGPTEAPQEPLVSGRGSGAQVPSCSRWVFGHIAVPAPGMWQLGAPRAGAPQDKNQNSLESRLNP